MEQKIVKALERISQAIRILAWKAGKALRLNPVQIQILLFLWQHNQKNNTVGSLAKEFTITKASISDSVSSLAGKNLVRKVYHDPRNFTIQLTTDGLKVAQEAISYTDGLSLAVNHLSQGNSESLFSALNEVIFALHTQGVISQRMCMTCKFHTYNGGQNFCQLLDKVLTINQLQIDCPDHVIA